MALFEPLDVKRIRGKYIKLFIDGVWACDEDGVPLLHRNRNRKVMFTDWDGRRWRRIEKGLRKIASGEVLVVVERDVPNYACFYFMPIRENLH